MINSRKLAGTIRYPIAAILLALPLIISPTSIAQTTANGTLYITGPNQPCRFLSEPQLFNSRAHGDTIVIGQQQAERYQVIIPGYDATALAHIRTCIVDAFATQSRIGSYVQVGSFDSRRKAETLRRRLRQAGYPARVIYRR